ncbi:MAG: ATP-binding protein, partial [Myxococcota bacterium]
EAKLEPLAAQVAQDRPFVGDGACERTGGLGHLRTDTEAKLEPLAALVQFMVSEEANKKALVAEVLDAYRENALLHKLSRTLASSLQSQRVVEIALEQSRRSIEGSVGLALLKGGHTTADSGTNGGGINGINPGNSTSTGTNINPGNSTSTGTNINPDNSTSTNISISTDNSNGTNGPSDNGNGITHARGHTTAEMAIMGGLPPYAAAAFGPEPLRAEAMELGQRVLRLVRETAKGELVNAVPDDARLCGAAVQIGALVWAPLRSNNRNLGVLLMGREEGEYAAADLGLLNTIALQAAPAFENALLYEEMERLVEERTQELSKAMEEANQANRAKSMFLANMSHELRTPLNGLLGYAQILKRERSLPPKHFEGLTIIQRSGEHLLTLINDILDLSKIEAGKIELSLATFDLHTLLDNLAALFRLRAERRGLQFSLHRSPALPAAMVGDPNKLRQVLMNLLSNAIKFTESPGQVTLTVTYHEGHTTTFRVSDTGMGIEPEEVEHIFRSFHQASHNRTVEGAGLGLAISHTLVALMGGTLEVERTAPSEGSVFVFSLDLPVLDQSELDLPLAKAPRTIVGVEGDRSFTLVVVDDQQESRAVIQGLLSPLGFTVIEAVDG